MLAKVSAPGIHHLNVIIRLLRLALGFSFNDVDPIPIAALIINYFITEIKMSVAFQRVAFKMFAFLFFFNILWGCVNIWPLFT